MAEVSIRGGPQAAVGAERGMADSSRWQFSAHGHCEEWIPGVNLPAVHHRAVNACVLQMFGNLIKNIDKLPLPLLHGVYDFSICPRQALIVVVALLMQWQWQRSY